MNRFDWDFEASRHDNGWDHTGIASFTEYPLKSLAREIIQNSLDNPIKQGDEVSEVTVTFKLFREKRALLPDMDSLQNALEQCLVHSKNSKESQDTQEEIQEALGIARASKIKILQITDSGTTGMEGPFEPGNAFYTFLNTTGSSPGSEDRAGSHGHGKFAMFANSNLRTIFVASNSHDKNGTLTSRCMGRSVLMSHVDGGIKLSQDGICGDADDLPVENLAPEYNWLNVDSKNRGTKISLIGFSDYPPTGDVSWEHELMGHAMTSFFSAFCRGKLKLIIESTGKTGTKKKISKENFYNLLDSKEIKASLEFRDPRLVNEFDQTKLFAECLLVPPIVQQAPPPLGAVDFYLCCDEKHTEKSYCLVRKDMKISHELPSLKAFSQKIKNFSCVIECASTDGNNLIRSMENSAHDKISIENNRNDARRKQGKILFKSLSEKFRKLLEREASKKTKGPGNIEFLSK